MEKGTLFKLVMKEEQIGTGLKTNIMQNQSLQKCKKDWDERLYKYARKRFNRISNIGWYKMFMTRMDFIHDNYLAYISKQKNFDRAQTFEQYYKRFNIRVIDYKKYSFSKRSVRGQEYQSRWAEFTEETNWDMIQQNFVTYPKEKLSPYIENYYFIKKFMEGYTFVELAKEHNTNPTAIRMKFLRETKELNTNKELREILSEYV